MLRLNCLISIGSYSFTYVNRVTINSSWDSFTDTATIVLPNLFSRTNKRIVEEFEVGSEVTIKLGYYPELNTVFTGYVSKVKPETPCVIECEDEMWILKQTIINEYSSKTTTLQELISGIFDLNSITTSYETIDMNLGIIRIEDTNITNVLQELKENYGIFSWYRNGMLYVGDQYYSGGSTVKLNMNGANCNVISSNFEIVQEDLQKYVIKGVSELSNDTKTQVFAFFNDEGTIETKETSDPFNLFIKKTQRLMSYYNLPKADMIIAMTRAMNNVLFDGADGDIELFGKPLFKHGYIADVIDLMNPDKDGQYLIKSVQTDFGIDGFRQIIEPEKRL